MTLRCMLGVRRQPARLAWGCPPRKLDDTPMSGRIHASDWLETGARVEWLEVIDSSPLPSLPSPQQAWR